MTTQNEGEKRYDRRDTTLKFVDRPDDLDPYADGLRAEMSCGHAVTPESLTLCCRVQLDQGQYKFKCPASKDGTWQKCNAVWSYEEVRKMAMLTAEEMEYFEEKIGRLAVAEYCEFQACPGCKTYVERKDLTHLRTQCIVCTSDKGKLYQFCWQCLNPWKGPSLRSNRCDNDGCISQHDLKLLMNCEMTDLPDVKALDGRVVTFPSIRACPTCGTMVEHDRTRCKNIVCSCCKVEFCFVCLKLKPECLKTSSHFIPCSAGVAPRQTSIPVWDKN